MKESVISIIIIKKIFVKKRLKERLKRMNISIFDVSGPVMVGPSSSHTAGAARLAYIARLIAAKPFHKVSFGLHGSFASTYKGHGTDRALVAGTLGLREDDERIEYSFDIAKKEGLEFDFYNTDLGSVHENTVKITFYLDNGEKVNITGSSVGGGQILITRINSFPAEIEARLSTIITNHNDKKGVISDITKILANNNINIAVMKLTRSARGKLACCVIESDQQIPDSVAEQLRKVDNMINIQVINIDQED